MTHRTILPSADIDWIVIEKPLLIGANLFCLDKRLKKQIVKSNYTGDR